MCWALPRPADDSQCIVPAPTTPLAGFWTWVDNTLRYPSQHTNQFSQRVRPTSERLAGQLGCHDCLVDVFAYVFYIGYAVWRWSVNAGKYHRLALMTLDLQTKIHSISLTWALTRWVLSYGSCSHPSIHQYGHGGWHFNYLKGTLLSASTRPDRCLCQLIKMLML